MNIVLAVAAFAALFQQIPATQEMLSYIEPQTFVLGGYSPKGVDMPYPYIEHFNGTDSALVAFIAPVTGHCIVYEVLRRISDGHMLWAPISAPEQREGDIYKSFSVVKDDVHQEEMALVTDAQIGAEKDVARVKPGFYTIFAACISENGERKDVVSSQLYQASIKEKI